MKKSTSPATERSTGIPTRDHATERTETAPDVVVSLHEGGIPESLETDLEQLYASLYSSCPMFRVYGVSNNVSTYVASRGGTPIAIFVFKRENSTVTVVNEQIAVGEDEIKRFADTVFATFKSVSVIVFRALDTRIEHFPFFYQKVKFTNDIVLELPASSEEYLAKLGSSTRQNIRYSLKRLKKDFPSFSYQVSERGGVSEQQFHDIMNLNQARMADKNKVCGVDDEERKRLFELVKVRGLAGAMTIDDRVCAGAVCYHIGENYFLRVLAHDSKFNTYGLGMLCCYLTVCECIARGGKQFRFMWGREEYKYRLLGRHQDFDALTIYRSRLAYAINISTIVQTLLGEYARRAKFWVLDPKNKDRAVSRFVQWSKKLLRGTKGTSSAQ
jgi:hypothetical protein